MATVYSHGAGVDSWHMTLYLDVFLIGSSHYCLSHYHDLRLLPIAVY